MKLISKGQFGLMLAMSAMLLLAAQPALAATTKFGAKVAPGFDPSNAFEGRWCDKDIDGGSDTYACTWILLSAFNGGTVTAPKNGTINKIKIINGHSGSFKVVMASKNASGQFKVTARSTKVSYTSDPCNPDCSVHTYSITPLTVKTGQYLGIQAAKTSTARCDSGGHKIALLKPPLAPGGAFTTPTGFSGCYLLVQALYAN